MGEVVEFPVKDINYLLDDDNVIVGVKGDSVSMYILNGGINFSFNSINISREELMSFVLLTGLVDDINEG